jgi:CheY-like chemotaxis protein
MERYEASDEIVLCRANAGNRPCARGGDIRKAVPIIAVTSYALSGDEANARAAGCNAYVTKPHSPRALLAKVREYLP